MPKHNKPNHLSTLHKYQHNRITQFFSIGGSMADSHFHKMSDRTHRWLKHTEEQIEATHSRGELPTKIQWIKLDLLRWLHRKYHKASLHSNGTGFIALFFGLLVALGFISLVSLLYVLLAISLIWVAPHAANWFFSFP
ncbi:MAG: hypothetical protein HOJ23_08165 [Gammaproteobacteria bacterium]|jgi:Flp pilus assembly protein TadB|nr:hypothetical protein [Gammaproteobacteria bacterium]